jgi:hypothetical protein
MGQDSSMVSTPQDTLGPRDPNAPAYPGGDTTGMQMDTTSMEHDSAGMHTDTTMTDTTSTNQ